MALIWIFQTGEPIQTDGNELRGMRAINLSEFARASGHEVVLWTSDFSHQKKEHRYKEDKEIILENGITIHGPTRAIRKIRCWSIT